MTNRRLYPKPWHSDYVLLTDLRKALEFSRDKFLSKRTDNTIVDYGCGDVPYRTLFDGMTDEYHACDFPGCKDANCHFDDQGKLPLPDRVADLILSVQVLEHVSDVDLYLKECFRVLKDDGLLILSTHGSWTYHPFPQDFRRWTAFGLETELAARGFKTVNRQSWNVELQFQLQLQCIKGVTEKLGGFGRLIFVPFCIFYQSLVRVSEWIMPDSIAKDNSAVYVISASKANTATDDDTAQLTLNMDDQFGAPNQE